MPGIAVVSVGSIKVASRVPLGSFAERSLADQTGPGLCRRPGRSRGFARAADRFAEQVLHVPVTQGEPLVLPSRAVPDEAYFQTVLRNAKGLTFAPGGARYMRWTEGEPHPDVLRLGDLDSMVASAAHFGRKFDELVDSSVLDRLDVLSRSSSPHGAVVIDDGISLT
jgi:hypothetical protein